VRNDPANEPDSPRPPAFDSPHFELKSRDNVIVESIPSLVPILADDHPSVAAEDGQVVLHRRSTNAELVDDDRFDVARKMLAAGQNLDDAAANRLGQYLEGMHDFTMSVRTNVLAN
jgi:hypothetical protein